MKYCPSCRCKIEEDTTVCPNCHVMIKKAEKTQTENEVRPADTGIQNTVSPADTGVQQSVQAQPVNNGSSFAGFVAGFLFSLIGLILVAMYGKKSTKNGAVIGFLVQTILWFMIF